ncbi:MAG: hypothetical protein M1812_000632 [Candelaria pacifica]|nr:MAG: hypothetical protein M1812_000632 [Candelaria pacifica]
MSPAPASKPKTRAEQRRQHRTTKQRNNLAHGIPGRGAEEETRRKATTSEKKALGVKKGLAKAKLKKRRDEQQAVNTASVLVEGWVRQKRVDEGEGSFAAGCDNEDDGGDEDETLAAAESFFSVGGDDAGEGWEEEEGGVAVEEAGGEEVMMQEAPEPVAANELDKGF